MQRELGCRAYLRFVDDFLLFSDDKKELWRWHTAVTHRLAQFRLTIHPQAQPRPVSKGISFLGFRIFPNGRRLKRRKGIQFQQKFKRLVRDYADGRIPFDQLTASVQGWVNHSRYANTVGLRKAVLTSQILPTKNGGNLV